jgi:hypothetical protein
LFDLPAFSLLFFGFVAIIELRSPGEMTLEDLRRLIENEEPYYKPYPGSDNPYRDGYYTEVSYSF